MPVRTHWLLRLPLQPSAAKLRHLKHKITWRTFWISTSMAQLQHLYKKNRRVVYQVSKVLPAPPSEPSLLLSALLNKATWMTCSEYSAMVAETQHHQWPAPALTERARAQAQTSWTGWLASTCPTTPQHLHHRKVTNRRRRTRISCRYSSV